MSDRVRNKEYRRSREREQQVFAKPKISLLEEEQSRLDALTTDMLPAIRRAEGNPNYGVLSIQTDDHRAAAEESIRNNYTRWIQSGASAAGVPFVEFMSDRYAPIGADNDPNHQNVNWTPNVTDILASTPAGQQYAARGVLANPARRRALYRKVDKKGNYIGNNTEDRSLGTESEALLR